MVGTLHVRISEYAKPALEQGQQVSALQMGNVREELLPEDHRAENHKASRGQHTENLPQLDGCVAGEEENTADGDSIDLWGNLREELQENILARLPLTKLFQVPVLSKGWRFVFRSRAFQDEVSSISCRWPVYCPVHLSRKGLVGYNAAAKYWEKLLPLSYLPYVPQGEDVVNLCSGAGSLICFARRNQKKEREMFRLKQRTSPIPLYLGQEFRRRWEQFFMAEEVDANSKETQDMYRYIDNCLDSRYASNLGVGAYEMYVTNVLTKQWKVLPTRPCMLRPHIVQLVAVGTSAYKVILITVQRERSLNFNEGPFHVQIYDSRTDSWTSRISPAALFNSEIKGLQASVYLDVEHVLYIVMQTLDGNRTSYQILAYNVEQDTWSRIPHPLATTHESLICELVACGPDVMLITGRSEAERVVSADPSVITLGRSDRWLVYRLDIELMTFVAFSGGPSRRVLKGGAFNVDLVIGAGDWIYFGLRSEPSDPILVFNIRQKLWSTLSPAKKCPGLADYLSNFRWTEFQFQPGLNPFVKLE